MACIFTLILFRSWKSLFTPRRTTREWSGYGMAGNVRKGHVDGDGDAFNPSTIISTPSVPEETVEVEFPTHQIAKPGPSPFDDAYSLHDHILNGDVKIVSDCFQHGPFGTRRVTALTTRSAGIGRHCSSKIEPTNRTLALASTSPRCSQRDRRTTAILLVAPSSSHIMPRLH